MNDRILRERTLRALCALLAACAAACGGVRTGRLAFAPSSAAAPPPAQRYLIQPGDELEIRFFHTPQYDVQLPVRPDGFISLPLAHELPAAGRTTEELRRELVERYRAEVAEPEIAVIVRSFTPYQVHVGGEVERPGVLQLSGAHDLLEAVFASGGFLPTADPTSVVVVRRLEPSGYEVVAADLAAVLKGRSAEGNLALRPFDVVFVPRSPIAELNKWVDQYIRKSIPVNFSYRLDL